MEFHYQAIDENGIRQSAVVKANSEKEVVEYLRSNNLIPIRIKKGSGNPLASMMGVLHFKDVGASDIALFTRELSSMILTGLTLLESLNTLKRQSDKPKMQQILDSLIKSISEGSSFSQALSNYPEVFSNVYISLIKAAETGGLLDKVLSRLADNLERSEDTKKQIRSALFYPAIIIIGVIAVVVVLNVAVIPQLGKLYEGLNVPLPLPTRIVLAISAFFINYYLFMIPIFLLLPFAVARFHKTKAGRRTIDKLKLKLPVLGQIVTLGILDEVARTLSLLISSGTSIIEALGVTSHVADNILYEEALQDSATLVEGGVTLSSALEHQNLFPIIFTQMVKVGESTGKIEDSFLRLAGYFERDLNTRIKTLTVALEPIIIVVLGIIIGALIISVIMPIYGIIGQLQA